MGGLGFQVTGWIEGGLVVRAVDCVATSGPVVVRESSNSGDDG